MGKEPAHQYRMDHNATIDSIIDTDHTCKNSGEDHNEMIAQDKSYRTLFKEYLHTAKWYLATTAVCGITPAVFWKNITEFYSTHNMGENIGTTAIAVAWGAFTLAAMISATTETATLIRNMYATYTRNNIYKTNAQRIGNDTIKNSDIQH